MQDKIQEIMTLLDIAVAEAEDGQPTFGYRCQIESKLRELVREPLSDEQMETLIEKHAPPIHPDFSEDDDFDELVRAVERAHGIDNASGVA